MRWTLRALVAALVLVLLAEVPAAAGPSREPVYRQRHDASLTGGPLPTNSCYEQEVNKRQSIWTCRMVERRVVWVAKSSAVRATPHEYRYGRAVFMASGVVYEGCRDYGRTLYRCQYRSTNHWVQRVTRSKVRNYYWPALKRTGDSAQCAWHLGKAWHSRYDTDWNRITAKCGMVRV